MIANKTALILGAGASCPYKFPTAQGLTDIIVSLPAGDLRDLIQKRLFEINPMQQNIIAFQNLLRNSQIYSIDKFLAENTDFEPMGRLFIAGILLQAERESVLHGDWYRVLYNELTNEGPDFKAEKLSIITFNYDRSLEHYLFRSLQAYIKSHEQTDTVHSLQRLKIVHVYGSLGLLPWQSVTGNAVPYGGREDIAYAAQNLDLVRRDGQPKAYAEILDILVEAERWVFLGFGFDPLNLKALGLGSDGAVTQKRGQSSKPLSLEVHSSAFNLAASEKTRMNNRIGGEVVFYDGKDALETLNSINIFV